MVESVRIAIIGAGFGGLGTALRLKQRGYHDFVILEKAADLGGTWRDNSYPGCACDVPSHVYSYSFIPNPNWSESFSGQPEIWAYLRDCAQRFGLTPHLRLSHEVTDARWDSAAQHWEISTSGGDFTAQLLVSAGGPLSEPAVPDLPGLATFAGRAFHSARWDHSLDLTGRRVAVIGTGASAIQFVPKIQPDVEHLTVFQRTAPWVMPRRNRRIRAGERRLFRAFPPAQRAARLGIYWARETMAFGFRHPPVMKIAEAACRRALARAVPDADLRAKLTPNFTPRLQAGAAEQRLPAGRGRSPTSRWRPRRSSRSGRTAWSPPTARNTRPTPSSSVPASTSPIHRPRSSSGVPTGAPWRRPGTAR